MNKVVKIMTLVMLAVMVISGGWGWRWDADSCNRAEFTVMGVANLSLKWGSGSSAARRRPRSESWGLIVSLSLSWWYTTKEAPSYLRDQATVESIEAM